MECFGELMEAAATAFNAANVTFTNIPAHELLRMRRLEWAVRQEGGIGPNGRWVRNHDTISTVEGHAQEPILYATLKTRERAMQYGLGVGIICSKKGNVLSPSAAEAIGKNLRNYKQECKVIIIHMCLYQRMGATQEGCNRIVHIGDLLVPEPGHPAVTPSRQAGMEFGVITHISPSRSVSEPPEAGNANIISANGEHYGMISSCTGKHQFNIPAVQKENGHRTVARSELQGLPVSFQPGQMRLETGSLRGIACSDHFIDKRTFTSAPSPFQ